MSSSRNNGRRTVVYPAYSDEAPELIPISGLTLVSEDQVGAEHTANQSAENLSDRAAITADEPFADDSVLKAMSDWSGTGRGSHVEFDHHEIVPLNQGQ
jgi:hypothetical protein